MHYKNLLQSCILVIILVLSYVITPLRPVFSYVVILFLPGLLLGLLLLGKKRSICSICLFALAVSPILSSGVIVLLRLLGCSMALAVQFFTLAILVLSPIIFFRGSVVKLVPSSKINPKMIVAFLLFFVFVLTLIIFPVLQSDARRMVSAHGFIHAGFFYELMKGSIPPELPFFAGFELHYPWFMHLAAVILSFVNGLAPSWNLFILRIHALFGLMLTMYMLAKVFGLNVRARFWTLFIAMFGVGFLHNILWLFNYMFSLKSIDFLMYWFQKIIEGKYYPLIKKFISMNANNLGMFFFLFFLYALFAIFSRKNEKPTFFDYTNLFFSMLGIALFYTLYLLPAVIILLVYFLYLVWDSLKRKDKCQFRKVGNSCISLISAFFFASPYLLSLLYEKQGAVFSLSEPIFILRKIGAICLIIVPLLLLGISFFIRSSAKEKDRTIWVMLGVGVFVALLLNLFLFIPLSYNEYKFMFIALLLLGVPAGYTIELFLRKRSSVSRGLLIFLILIIFLSYPAATIIGKKPPSDVPFSIKEYGRFLLPLPENSEAAQMYLWIRDNTPSHAIFFDPLNPYVSIFSQRKLFVSNYDRGLYGYLTSGEVYLRQIQGYPEDVINERIRIKDIIYSERTSNDRQVISALHSLREFGSPIYIIYNVDLFPPAHEEKFKDQTTFDLVYSNTMFHIYRLHS